MKIKVKLQIHALIYVGMTLLAASTIFWAANRIEFADRNERIAGEIVQQISVQTSLITDYLLYHEERAKIQWLSEQESISKILLSQAVRFDLAEEKTLMDKLFHANDSVGLLFKEIVKNNEKQNVNDMDTAVPRELEARLASRLLLKTNDCIEISVKLQVLSADISELTNKQSLTLIVVFVVMLSITIFYNTVALTKTLSQRIGALLKGVSAYGTGNFTHIIAIKGDDEFSELARASNEMATSLKESYTSIKNLEEEIERRRHAELEQKRLLDIIEESSNEIYVFDSNTLEFEYINQGALKNIGYTLLEMKRMTPLDIKPEINEASFMKLIRPLIAKEKDSLFFETKHRRKNGTDYPVEVHLQLFREEGRNTFFAVINDITERRRAEESLRESNDFLNNLITYANAPIIVWDSEFHITRFNYAFEALTGRKAEEVVGKSPEILFPLDQVDTSMELISKTQNGARWETVEIDILHLDGSIRTVLWNSATIFANEGKTPVATIAQGQDISERKRAEELIQIRMRLMEYSSGHTLEELLRKTLDEVGRLVDSPIGFYHFVEADQKTLSLQAWSTLTLERFCKAEGKGLHYSIDKAGVWVDCVRQRKPVTHNDYASHPNRKGMPEGHAAVIRELVVPIIRDERIVAILGVGNKPQEYTQQDATRVHYLADVAWEIVERIRAEQSLIDSVTKFHTLSEEYHTLLDNLPDGVAQISPDNRIVWTNQSIKEMVKTNEPHLQGTLCYSAFWNQSGPCVSCPVSRSFITGNLEEEKITLPDGRIFELRAVPIFNELGIVESVIEVIRDITEHRKIEAQLLQAQKMESVGRLAGGVAHDYNNMLTVIVGYSELALEKLTPSDALFEELREIHKAGVRSVEITRQLLAFARKQTIAPVVLDLNDAVEGMLKMLKRLIGEDIDLAWLPCKDVWSVKMDPSQLDQLLANLCVNARDAIEGVGRVTIETDTATFDKDYCVDHPGFVAGEYVLLAISDDGCGMDHDTVGKIFDPFFTTKAVGQGTGLGLATVHGIVKQNNGFINVYSEPGEGTTFKIYLTRYTGLAVESPRESLKEIPMGHGEVILVVEDEISILKLAKKTLEELGYLVLTAENPSQALHLVKEHQGKVDLLITDVVMPEMNGRELSKKLSESCPGLRTVFMSGYTANVIAHHGVLDEGVNFVQKPFSQASMAFKVKEAMEA